MLSWKQIPQRRKSNEELSRDNWAHVHLRTNTFTWGEWPEQELQSSGEFSIGEEQSPSTVTWLAWSPPGLAKHKRSVLAVLTSNHVLSLWASNSDMAVPESWERVCFVNDAVKAALREQRFKERLKSVKSLRLKRIRSAAWASMLNLGRGDRDEGRVANEVLEIDTSNVTANGVNRIHTPPGDIFIDSDVDNSLSLPKKQHLLAAANDCAGVYIIEISSPFTNTSNAWEANLVEMCFLPTHDNMIQDVHLPISPDDAVAHVNIEQRDVEQLNNSRAFNTRPSLLTAAFAKTNFIEDISWSPWKNEVGDATKNSILTVQRNGAFSQSLLRVKSRPGSIQCSFSTFRTKKQDLLESTQRFTRWFLKVHSRSSLKA